MATVSKHLFSENDDLLKAVTKCLAHFTHGCDMETAGQVRGGGEGEESGFNRLIDLMSHGVKSIWEAAVACIVNLSHIDSLRPSLGNLGTISALVKKVF